MKGERLYEIWHRIKDKALTQLVRSSFAELGRHSIIAGRARLVNLKSVAIGDNSYIGEGSWIEGAAGSNHSEVTLRIGNRVSISGRATISGQHLVEIMDDVLIASGVHISDVSHNYDGKRAARDLGVTKPRPVRLEQGCWIGANVVIMPGVTVGKYSVVGANSVVLSDVMPSTVVAGAPATIVKDLRELPN